MIAKGLKIRNHYCTVCGKEISKVRYLGELLMGKYEETKMLGIMSEIHNTAICKICYDQKYPRWSGNSYEKRIQRIKEKCNVKKEEGLLQKLFK